MESVFDAAELVLAFVGLCALAAVIYPSAPARRPPPPPGRLDYDVVPDEWANDPRKTPYLLWHDFARAVLGSPGYAAFHDQVRRDDARFRVEFAGKTLLVLVR